VCRKDWYWSVRAVYVLDKLSDVSGPGLGVCSSGQTRPPSGSAARRSGSPPPSISLALARGRKEREREDRNERMGEIQMREKDIDG
jgi:hypothetical protein